jgi:hypothetical protein
MLRRQQSLTYLSANGVSNGATHAINLLKETCDQATAFVTSTTTDTWSSPAAPGPNRQQPNLAQ